MSNVHIKSPEELDKMRVSGRLAAEVLQMIAPYVRPGVTTGELDRMCHDYIVDEQGAHPSPLNYHGFPKSVCTSVNHQVCHGIPGDRELREGDLINIDVTVNKDGFHGDTSKTFLVGSRINPKARKVTEVAHDAMVEGIERVRPGVTLGDIGHAIQSYAESQRCSVVREYCGHGIGRNFHEEPQVMHYGRPGEGMVLQEGMTFTIEPMINAGKRHVKVLADEWTVVTKDHSPSAQFEHTLAVTADGYEVLTQLPGDPL
jgi:methionyl aminopeptidase